MSAAATPAGPPRVFISYARQDGEALARSLRDRLQAAGIPLWRDREGMEGGRDWWQQITTALDSVEFLVLVMTPAALRSPLVRREWRHARQQGVVVYPVHDGSSIDFAQMPRWMRSVHFYDLQHEWVKFVNDLQTRPQPVRVPFMVEDLPEHFVARPREYERLLSQLLDREHEEPIAITAALRGAGGYGKTALARALCHDPDVQNAFDDGILWVTLGEQPGNLVARVEDLIFMLSGERPGFAGIDAAAAALAALLGDRDILLVVDDVWDATHLAPFLQGGRHCARIVTTRLADVLPRGAHRIDVDAMSRDEALALIGFGLPAGHEAALAALAVRLGEWPMLLRLVNATLSERVGSAQAPGQPLPAALAYVNKALDKRGLTFFDARDPVARHQAVSMTIGVSLGQLDTAEQQRFDELAVFAEDVPIPLSTLARYWGATGGLDDFDTESLCERLKRLSLVLDFDPTARFIRLHDVVGQFLQLRHPERLPALHAQWAASARPASGHWADLPTSEPYAWRWLFHHLKAAGLHEELLRTAADLRWLAAKTLIVSTVAVESDLLITERVSAAADVAPPLRAAGTAARALRRSYVQSAHLLARCKAPGDAQATLVTRLQHVAELAPWLPQWLAQLPAAHLQALHPLPDLPEPALLRTLGDHRGSVLCCALSADGAWLATGGEDGAVRLWDTQTGSLLQRLQGHVSWVRGLAFSADGRLLASASTDRRLRLWDLASGRERAALTGHTDALTGCAFAPDGSWVASSSLDGTVRLWDVAGACVRCVLGRVWADDGRRSTFMVAVNDQGHWSSVRACAVSPDGQRLVSASSDQTLILWDTASGKALFELARHDAAVAGCCYSRDGLWIASVDRGGAALVWNALSGELAAALQPQSAGLTGCAFGPGDATLVCSSDDGTARIWDIASGRQVRTLAGHTGMTNGVAVAAGRDFMLAATASSDGSARLWNLDAAAAARTAAPRVERLTGCAAHPAMPWAATSAENGQLTLWDLASGQPRWRRSGRGNSDLGCTFNGDGRLLARVSEPRWVERERPAVPSCLTPSAQ